MAASTLDAVTNFLIWRANQDEDLGENITNLKLQKLVYYAQGFYLAWHGERLFDDPIEAWQHGPVVPALYHRYKHLGASPIPTPEEFDPASALNSEIVRVLEEMYAVYGQYSAWGLRNLTHDEAPWRDARKNSVISPDVMRDYFATYLVNAQ